VDKKVYVALAVLLAASLVATAYAAAVLYYTWNINATIAEPKVKFYKWSDGTTSTTFTYTCNIYNGIEMRDSNITHALYNTDANAQTVKMRIKSISSTSVVSNVTITVYSSDGSSTIATCTWTTGGSLPTSWQQFTLAANAKHAMAAYITGAASSGSTTITLEVEAPA